MYIYICMYIYTYICMYLACYHENNVPSCLSPQWLCGNSCTWARDVWLNLTEARCVLDQL